MQHRGTGQQRARAAHGAWPLTLALAACSAEAVDLGDGRLQSDRSPLESSGTVWDGYAELYQFPSGSDRIRLTLDGLGGGSVAFGEGTERPTPPIDADHAFDFGPEEYRPLADYDWGTREFPESRSIWEGLPYPAIRVRIDEERVRFDVDMASIYAAACALQEPVAFVRNRDRTPTNTHVCLPEEGQDYDTAEGCFIGGRLDAAVVVSGGTQVSCSKKLLCRFVCECTAAQCTPREGMQRADLALDASDQQLDGSMNLTEEPWTVVRLTRTTQEQAP